jgi:general secretion pathway protein E
MAYSREIGEERREFIYGSGCKSCAGSGYRGRTGIFEILRTSDEIKTLLLKGTNASMLRKQAISEGMVTLMKDGMLKVKENLTTPSEVLRNAYAVE